MNCYHGPGVLGYLPQYAWHRDHGRPTLLGILAATDGIPWGITMNIERDIIDHHRQCAEILRFHAAHHPLEACVASWGAEHHEEKARQLASLELDGTDAVDAFVKID